MTKAIKLQTKESVLFNNITEKEFPVGEVRIDELADKKIIAYEATVQIAANLLGLSGTQWTTKPIFDAIRNGPEAILSGLDLGDKRVYPIEPGDLLFTTVDKF